MFKPTRWWSDKNKVKVVFKLQFHASQVAQIGENGLIISVVPSDIGKTTVKSSKATVRDGSCLWENPVYETVKFNQDPKSGKIHEKIYYFVVGTGSSKSSVLGEASIDFSNYVESTKVSLVSLPLKSSKCEAVLHVSIQRVLQSMDQRENEENENIAKLSSEERSLSPLLSNHDRDGTIRSSSVEQDVPSNKAVSQAEFDAKRRGSSGSDITLSSSGSSCGVEPPWELKNDNVHQESISGTPTPTFDENRKSWEWLGNCGIVDSTDDSSSTVREAFLTEHSEEVPDLMVERLKTDVAALSRQAEMSELELQALRKQIVKERKRGQDLGEECVCLKEERDTLKAECEQLKAFKRERYETKCESNVIFDGTNSWAIVKELRQELYHAKELNSNLRVQLEKTQESNSELILAVQDLEELLEQKNMEVSDPSRRLLEKEMDDKSREIALISQPDHDDYNDDDDEEQKALEDLVKEHSDAKESFLLERQIMDLQSEIEIYKKDKDELEMQMEQLALDYEIIKQANHEMSHKLEQSQIQEQLKFQYECSSPNTVVHELESRVESLETELELRTKEYEDSLVSKSDLQSHVKSLEEELEKQVHGFEADLESLTITKIEHEQRAIRAEETLKKMRWRNANTAERLQEEFRKLSVQMASTFETNEKLATKALAEANQLHLEKSHLEEMLRKTSEEHQSVESDYETILQKLNSQVTLMSNQIEQMHSEIDDKVVQLEHQKRHAEDTQKVLRDEISMLKDEIETHIANNKILLEDMGNKDDAKHDLDQMRISIRDMELLVEQGNVDKTELESKVSIMKTEAEELHKELNELKSMVKQKGLIAEKLQLELDSLQARCLSLQLMNQEDELEKEKLRKQVLQLRSDLKKESCTEKKTKDIRGRAPTVDAARATPRTSKPNPRESKEVANLKDKIKLLECQIKLNETALETSANAFQEKEKNLMNKIEELGGKLELNRSSGHSCGNEVEKGAAAVVDDQIPNLNFCEEGNNDKNSSTRSSTSSLNCRTILSTKSNNLSDVQEESANATVYDEELKEEMASLEERNKSMERDLKEMQERYLDISLKFAEVEGERQQLVMRLRCLTNASKSS